MFEILPSPGTEQKEWPALEKRIQTLLTFTKRIHIDILDGKFAPNTTLLDPQPLAAYTKDALFEVHLMVEEPINYLDSFAQAGFTRFIGQVEKMSDQVEFVAQGQLLGEVGLAIDGKTSLDQLHVPLDDLDCLLVMTINAGFSGQAFMPEHLEKVKTLAQKTTIPIEVDGGINADTVEKAREAGATRAVVTSAIFNHHSPKIAYHHLQHLVTAAEQESR